MQYRNLDKQAIKENAYTVLSKISIVGTNIVLTENDSIISWEYEDYRYVPDNGFVGQFVERLLDGNLRDVPDGVILEDTEINLQLGIVNGIDNQTTWYDYGNFLVTKVEKADTTGNYKFESADYTKKFNQVFNGDYTNTTYTKSFNQKIEDEETVTALWLAQYVCAQAGVQLYTTNFTNYNFAITSNQYDSEDTLRKVMQDIGKLAYSWVRVGTDNKVYIDFTPKATSSVDTYNTLTTDEYYVSKKSDLAFGPVNKVLIGMSAVDGENMYETSSSYTPETECAIKIWDNNITNTQELRALALNGCDRLFGITYTPIEIESIGHPWLEGDDLIKLTNVDNEVIYTYAFNRKLEYAGYIEGTISSEAATVTNNKYEYKSDIISSVKRTTIEVDKQNQTITALAENVSDNTSDISQLEIDLNGIDLRVQSVETTQIDSVTNEYAKNTSATNPPAQSSSSWSTTTPTRGEGEYIWARIKTTYHNGNVIYSNPVNTTGDKGDDGGTGASIDTITQYYAVSSSNSTTPSSWTTDLSSITLTSTNKYLWNYAVTTYTEGKPSTGSASDAKVIGVYGDTGGTGPAGAEGRGITSITNYYLATSSSSGVTRSTSGWTTTYQSMTEQKPYLWNYQKIIYTKGTTTQYVEPMIIGVYGLPGSDGKGITSVTELYYVSDSSTAPSKPSSHVTTSSLSAYNSWNLQCPQYTTTYQYFYTCSEILYTDNTYGWTNVTQNQALAFANENSSNAISRLNFIGEIITGTHTSNTRFWTGVSTLSSLVDGQQIMYWNPRNTAYTNAESRTVGVDMRQNSTTTRSAGTLISSFETGTSSNNVWLNLTLANGTETGWIPCYMGSGASRLTTHYNGGRNIHFTYKVNANVAGVSYTGWFADGNYDSGNTLDNQITYFAGKTGAKGIWQTSLFMEDGNGTYQNICTASDGTVTTSNRTNGTTKKANTNGFKVGGSIYYTNTSYNANTNISGWGVVYSSITSLFDSRYSLNTTLTAGSLTTYKPIYLVGEINDTDGLFYLDSTWWTQTPTTEGKIYVLLGSCYDSSTSNCRIVLYEDNLWLTYTNGSLVEYNKARNDFNYGAIEDINTNLSNYVTTTTYDADWVNRKNEIYSYVGETYTTTSDFGSYQQTMQTALSQKADTTTISATATQIVNNAMSGIADTISNVEETFTFSTGGLEIARGGSTMSLLLGNDKLSFKNNGQEKMYMTSDSLVLYQLKRLQLGNYAFEVRTNGSIDFKKVQ